MQVESFQACFSNLFSDKKLKKAISTGPMHLKSASSAVILRGKTSKQSSLILFVSQSAGSVASTCSRYSPKQCRIKSTFSFCSSVSLSYDELFRNRSNHSK